MNTAIEMKKSQNGFIFNPLRVFLTLLNKIKNHGSIPFMLPSLIVYFAAHLLYWPAQMSPDSHTQWLHITTGIFHDVTFSGHPFLSTLWLLPGKLIGHSPAIVIMINYTIFSIFTGLILNISNKNYGINQYWCYLFSFIFPLIPSNFIHLTTLWKDIPYTLGFVILLYGTLKLLSSEEKRDLSTTVLILIGLFLIFFMRFNGLVVVAGTLLSFLILKPQLKKIWFTLSIILLFSLILLRSYFIFFNINEVPIKYNAIHSVHYLSYLIKNDVAVEQEDLDFLNKIMPVNEWKDRYNPFSVGYLAHKGYFKNPYAIKKETQSELNRLGLKYLFKYPFEFLEYKYSSVGTMLISPKPSQYIGARVNLSYPFQDYIYFTTKPFNNFAPWYFLYSCIILYLIKRLFYSDRVSQFLKIRSIKHKLGISQKQAKPLSTSNFLLLISAPTMNIISLALLSTDYCYRYYYPTFVVSCFILLLLLAQTKPLRSDS
jgi:hypothetical protein